MIKRVKRYIIICDKCEDFYDEENGAPNETNFSTIKDAREYLDKNSLADSWYKFNWIRKGNKIYCDECNEKRRLKQR